jgi:DNA-binding NtrC family response regulator
LKGDLLASNKILIVDREPDILKLLEILLTKRGYQVKGATNSEDAIANFRNEYFDLVITEIRIPRLGGNNFIRQLKNFDEEVEVIVLTGFSAHDSEGQVTQGKGAFAYLTKPLEDIDQLYITVSQAMEKRNAHHVKGREGERINGF